MNWEFRKRNLLKELLTYNADILLLQGVDHYTDWWQPQLGVNGYDSLYKSHPQKGGVAVFYRRDEFQLFMSEVIEFKELRHEKVEPVFAEDQDKRYNLENEDVALVAALQPWEKSRHPSALCVVSTDLDETRTFLRTLQVRRLTERIESFNSKLQIPIVLAGTLYLEKNEEAYLTLVTGCKPKIERPPGRPSQPLCTQITTASVTVQWSAPPVSNDDIVRYRLERRGVDQDQGCTKSKTFGNTMFVKDTKHIVTELASNSSYEFRVCAESKVGAGLWSPISDIVTTKSHAFYTKNNNNKNNNKDLFLLPAGLGSSNTHQQRRQRRRETSRRTNMFKKNGKRMFLNAALLEGDDAIPPASGLTPRTTLGTFRSTTTPIRCRELKFDTARGLRPKNLIHSLNLRSAYALSPDPSTGIASEPLFSMKEEGRIRPSEYIMFSCERLTPISLLAIPKTIRSVDPRQPQRIRDIKAKRPENFSSCQKYIIVPNYETGLEGEIENPDYEDHEKWEPPLIENPNRYHSFIPNHLYSSSHLAMVATFEFEDPNLATVWH